MVDMIKLKLKVLLLVVLSHFGFNTISEEDFEFKKWLMDKFADNNLLFLKMWAIYLSLKSIELKAALKWLLEQSLDNAKRDEEYIRLCLTAYTSLWYLTGPERLILQALGSAPIAAKHSETTFDGNMVNKLIANGFIEEFESEEPGMPIEIGLTQLGRLTFAYAMQFEVEAN